MGDVLNSLACSWLGFFLQPTCSIRCSLFFMPLCVVGMPGTPVGPKSVWAGAAVHGWLGLLQVLSVPGLGEPCTLGHGATGTCSPLVRLEHTVLDAGSLLGQNVKCSLVERKSERDSVG